MEPKREQETMCCSVAQEAKTNQQVSKKMNNVVPYYKLFSFADSIDLALMIVGTIAAIANGLAPPLGTLNFGTLMNSFGQNTDPHIVVHEVSKASLKFVYLGIGVCLAAFLQVACWTVTGERQASRIRDIYLKSILRQDIEFFDREMRTGEVVGRMSGDSLLIHHAIGEKVGQFIQLLSSFFGGFALAFVHGWQLTLVMLAAIPLIASVTALMSNMITKMAANAQTSNSEASDIVEQTIASIRTVVSYTGEKQALMKYNMTLKTAYKSNVLEGLAAGIGMGTANALVYSGYALGTWFGSKMILHNGYTGGDVMRVIVLVLVGSKSLGQLSPCRSAFAAGQAAAFKMFETINRKPKIDGYDTTGKSSVDIRGDIELRDIHFSYPGRPDEHVFTDLSLLIPSGSTVALVGESGSGKSSVISLIERFYDPQAGEVLIDGTNIKKFSLRWIRGKIGLVSQEPVLFASSIKDNIAYGKDGATIEEIKAAAESANALKFIEQLPQGLDTMVGAHGAQLSGGEKQRVAIARAILKDPKILLLDEATSALDLESERIVQEALDKVMASRTTVIVAHRLSTVRNADLITVLHRGSVIEKGSHAELIKNKDGVYSQLIHLQEANENFDHQNETSHRKQGVTSSDNIGSRSLRVATKEDDLQDSKLQEPECKQLTQEKQEVPLSRLARLNKPELLVILFGAIAAVISGMIMPTFGMFLANTVHSFYEPATELQKNYKFWSLMFLGLSFITIVSVPARSYLFAVAGSKLIRRIRLMSFDKLIHMEVGWFDEPENSSGVIGARLSAGAAAARSLVGDALSLVVQNAATLITGLVIALYSCWQLALLILTLIPLMSVNGWIQLKLMKEYTLTVKMMYEGASQVASDAIGSIRTVASFSAEEKVMQLYKRKCEGPRNAGIKQGLISGIGFGLSFLLLFSSYAASFHVGAALIEDDKTTYTKVFRVFFVLALVAAGVSESSSLLPDAAKAKSAAASVFEILDRKSKIHSGDKSGITLQQVKGNIEFQHVCFKYPTRPDVQILKGLCLTVQSGKTVALVGESGSGKSTVISLLQRFYDPDSGSILLDGIETQKFQVKWLRQQMGLVSQEPILFNDTIRANIAYGKGEEATESEVVVAAELANAHHFISGLQQGYDTIVGERGIQLSGGQKQRVAIARAIIKEPKILLLDEATSALDAESEKMVQNALDKVMLKKTSVIVAHQLSTIKDADLIVVVKNGIIIEKGKHEDLMTIKDGAYASLVALHTCH
ncbi:ABC transporter B family member 11-like isoform X1 [Dioscorea cayenensis subsp. rotundata]|uniref:ABC transporter B family member 11-like isoform X1 n=2 Tax=Dioscorea cayennensis subsp. rotundata TaxID=55577 RepID=A0AB40BMK9_DIOCR|nr:ABC transporter B family member 11-like isoform X1 [Dioscorea cayenensis subsp. rotundata]